MDETYMLFGHCGARYALEARAVREITWLPELSPIEELPQHIVGVFNLRGRIVPVMDLGVRFGRPRETHRLSDCVVVVESEGVRAGVVVNELHDVATIAQAAIEGVQDYQALGGRAHFVRGQAKLSDGLAMLLDVNALLCGTPPEEALAEDLAALDPAIEAPAEGAQASPHLFGELSPAEAELFRSRARSLAKVQEVGERPGLEAYAVIRLGAELFALGLDAVREFAHLRAITPVPCCPPHIVGNMNLRGDILTLVDIGPAPGRAADRAMSEVVVARIGDLLLGLPATEIVDVVRLAPSDIAPLPVASDRAGDAYCKGVAAVGGQAVGILDPDKILPAREPQAATQNESKPLE